MEYALCDCSLSALLSVSGVTIIFGLMENSLSHFVNISKILVAMETANTEVRRQCFHFWNGNEAKGNVQSCGTLEEVFEVKFVLEKLKYYCD